MAKTCMASVAVVCLTCICFVPVRGGPPEPESDIVGVALEGGKNIPHRGKVDFGGTWVGGEECLINFVVRFKGETGFNGDRIEIRNSPDFSRRPYQNTSQFVKRHIGGSSYWFSVAFAPRKRGRCLGTLIIRGIGPGGGSVAYAADLTGTAWKVEYLVLSGDGSRVIPCGINPIMTETGTDYGRVRVGSSTSRMFLVMNSLKDPWLKPGITLAGDHAEDFILPWKGLTRRIKGQMEKPKPMPGDYRLSQYVYFAPKAPGIRRARILIRNGSGRDQAKPCEIHIQGEAFE